MHGIQNEFSALISWFVPPIYMYAKTLIYAHLITTQNILNTTINGGHTRMVCVWGGGGGSTLTGSSANPFLSFLKVFSFCDCPMTML